MKHSFFLIAFLILILFSCSKEKVVVPLNPNGDSELAILMRQMYEDGMSIKKDIINGKRRLSTTLKHKAILTAEATEPEKVETEIYKSLADGYLEISHSLNDRKNPNREETYNNLINSCLQCHNSMCPGPIVKINKLVMK